MQHISQVLHELYPNIDRLAKVEWSRVTFKTPVVFRDDRQQFIIRNMRNIKGTVMCECVMDDDSCMRNINDLPEDVRKQIDYHLKLQG